MWNMLVPWRVVFPLPQSFGSCTENPNPTVDGSAIPFPKNHRLDGPEKPLVNKRDQTTHDSTGELSESRISGCHPTPYFANSMGLPKFLGGPGAPRIPGRMDM